MGQPHTSATIASALKAELVGRSDLAIVGIETLGLARSDQLSFIRDPSNARQWPASRAGAALVSRGVEVPGHDPSVRALIRVADADLALIECLRLFAPPPVRHEPGVHPTAIVHPSARIAPGVSVGPACIVGAETIIAEGSVLVSGVILGAHVRIGRGTLLHPGVTVMERCSIGDGCILWPHAVIGADGFGYRPAPDGRGFIKIPHVGSVEIHDGVEIGACSCIDRGKFSATVIGAGTKIDNHVQIGHNVRIGRCCIICALTGIAGSVVIEDGVLIGGHSGIADNLHIGTRARISAKAGVISDVPAGETYFGYPAGPHKDQMRSFAALRKLTEHLRTIKRAEKLLAQNGLLAARAEAAKNGPVGA
ncbi:MAG: UDP-3-O-(3-hydroxymyristoyl)glucosamine N-acyltransferase [Phycisphaerae bacterium]|nr:UDP-3-O-(3-hydroxymyristoyl)glucosamine N-acyltransferase [Phycisphaerae bacterium]